MNRYSASQNRSDALTTIADQISQFADSTPARDSTNATGGAMPSNGNDNNRKG